MAAPSVAVHVTDVEPSGNVEPGSFGLQWTVGAMPLLSLASMLQVTVAPLGPVASVSLGGVTKIVGLPVSVTVTLKLVVAGGLPAASDAVQVTGVVPIGKEPGPGKQLTATLPSTMS